MHRLCPPLRGLCEPLKRDRGACGGLLRLLWFIKCGNNVWKCGFCGGCKERIAWCGQCSGVLGGGERSLVGEDHDNNSVSTEEESEEALGLAQGSGAINWHADKAHLPHLMHERAQQGAWQGGALTR